MLLSLFWNLGYNFNQSEKNEEIEDCSDLEMSEEEEIRLLHGLTD